MSELVPAIVGEAVVLLIVLGVVLLVLREFVPIAVPFGGYRRTREDDFAVFD